MRRKAALYGSIRDCFFPPNRCSAIVQRRSCSRRFAALRTPPPGRRAGSVMSLRDILTSALSYFSGHLYCSFWRGQAFISLIFDICQNPSLCCGATETQQGDVHGQSAFAWRYSDHKMASESQTLCSAQRSEAAISSRYRKSRLRKTWLIGTVWGGI